MDTNLHCVKKVKIQSVERESETTGKFKMVYIDVTTEKGYNYTLKLYSDNPINIELGS